MPLDIALDPYAVAEDLAPRIDALDLRENVRQLVDDGYTVIQAPVAHARTDEVRAAILRCAQGTEGRAKGYSAGVLLGREPVFAEAVLVPRLLAMVEFLLGRGFILSQLVGSVMTKENLVTVAVGTTLEEAERILQKHRIEKLLVVDQDFNLKGLITVKDIQKKRAYPRAAGKRDHQCQHAGRQTEEVESLLARIVGGKPELDFFRAQSPEPGFSGRRKVFIHGPGASSAGIRTTTSPACRISPARAPASSPETKKISARAGPSMAEPVSWAIMRRRNGEGNELRQGSSAAIQKGNP